MKQKINFIDPPPPYFNKEKAKGIVLAIPFEWSTSYIKGTVLGPERIIQASNQIELYDEYLYKNIYEIGIYTDDSLIKNKLKVNKKRKAEIVIEDISNKVLEYLPDKFVISLGGEHTITYPIVRAYKKFFNDFTVVHFDAHADLRDKYEGSKLSHASVMKRILDMKLNIVSFGLRSLSEECKRHIEDKDITAVLAHDCLSDEAINNALSKIKGDVYISVDLDVLDPSVMPAVGTPEPGGLSWYKLNEILYKISMNNKVIGCDVVELCPIKNVIFPDVTAARLVYRMIGLFAK